jgi:hypothetical protein
MQVTPCSHSIVSSVISSSLTDKSQTIYADIVAGYNTSLDTSMAMTNTSITMMHDLYTSPQQGQQQFLHYTMSGKLAQSAWNTTLLSYYRTFLLPETNFLVIDTMSNTFVSDKQSGWLGLAPWTATKFTADQLKASFMKQLKDGGYIDKGIVSFYIN